MLSESCGDHNWWADGGLGEITCQSAKGGEGEFIFQRSPGPNLHHPASLDCHFWCLGHIFGWDELVFSITAFQQPLQVHRRDCFGHSTDTRGLGPELRSPNKAPASFNLVRSSANRQSWRSVRILVPVIFSLRLNKCQNVVVPRIR